MHVVHVRDPKHPREENAEETGLFMRVQQVIPFGQHQAQRSKQQEHIQEQLRLGGSDRHVTDKTKDGCAKNRHARNYEVLSHMVGHQIHIMAKLR